MTHDDVLILDSSQVCSLLEGQELHLMELVRNAYIEHARGDSSLPHSTFLTFPGRARERIIALPAYLGGNFQTAGMKWIASFPNNTLEGLDRASAVIILNSLQTGRPQAIVEGATISAARTAASAVLAASVLKPAPQPIESACFIGCGLINFEIARFLAAVEPMLRRFVVHDIHPDRAERQRRRLQKLWPNAQAVVAADLQSAMRESDLISFATTAIEPYVTSLTDCRAGATILHVSLRDLQTQCVTACDNITDDIDHVCRANTTLHLAEQLTGSRSFIRCTLADVLMRASPARASATGVTVFSPFGLGILDLAVAQWVAKRAAEKEVGLSVPFFTPTVANDKRLQD